MTNDLPPGWIATTLGDVFEIVGGSTPRTDNPDYWDGDIPWVTPDDLSTHQGVKVSKGRRSITEAGFASTSTHMLPENSILFTSRAPIGYTAIAANPLCTNQGFKSLVPPAGVESRYAYWYLRHMTPQIRKLGSGTTFKEMSKKRMTTVPFILPPTAEQKRIVTAIEEHFTRLDAASDTVTVAQARVEASRLSVLTEAFAGKLVPQDRNDETASALLDRIAADQRTEPAAREAHHGPSRLTRDLPPGWAWARLEDLAAAEPRAITDGPFGSNLKTAHYTDGGPRVIRLQNIGDGVFRPEDAHISDEHYSLLAQHSVQADDLVVASLGETLPRACLVPSWVPPAIVKADCIRVRLHPEVNPSYVNFALRHPGLRQQTSTEIKGVGRPRLGLRGIRNLPVPLAPLAEQHRVVAVIEEHFSRLDATSQVLVAAKAKIEDLRRCVLSEAFRGRLVPQDPTDEAASILLERIAASRDLRRRGRRSSHDNTPGGHRS